MSWLESTRFSCRMCCQDLWGWKWNKFKSRQDEHGKRAFSILLEQFFIVPAHNGTKQCGLAYASWWQAQEPFKIQHEIYWHNFEILVTQSLMYNEVFSQQHTYVAERIISHKGDYLRSWRRWTNIGDLTYWVICCVVGPSTCRKMRGGVTRTWELRIRLSWGF